MQEWMCLTNLVQEEKELQEVVKIISPSMIIHVPK